MDTFNQEFFELLQENMINCGDIFWGEYYISCWQTRFYVYTNFEKNFSEREEIFYVDHSDLSREAIIYHKNKIIRTPWGQSILDTMNAYAMIERL